MSRFGSFPKYASGSAGRIRRSDFLLSDMAQANPSRKSEDIEMENLPPKSPDGAERNVPGGNTSGNQESASDKGSSAQSDGEGSSAQSDGEGSSAQSDEPKCCIKSQWDLYSKKMHDEEKKRNKFARDMLIKMETRPNMPLDLDRNRDCETGNAERTHLQATRTEDYYKELLSVIIQHFDGTNESGVTPNESGVTPNESGVTPNEDTQGCWEAFCDFMKKGWKAFCEFMKKGWKAFCEFMKKGWKAFCEFMKKGWKACCDFMIQFLITPHTDFVCYFLFILNMMLNPSLLSGILPFVLFFCACFCNIRYNTVLWVIAEGWTLGVFIARLVFHLRSFSWNSQEEINLHQNEPFWWPRIVGIEKSVPSLVMDSLQFLFVLLQIVLQCPGFPRCWCNGASEATDNGEAMTTIKEKSCICCCCCKETKCKKKDENIYDVYLLMLVCDIINFLIFAFAYWSFGFFSTHHTNLLTHLQSNHVPHELLILLLGQLLLMFLDRIRYLLHCYCCGILYHTVVVVGVHVFLFWFVPYYTNRPFNQNCFAQIWYFFKAVYFLLSGYQIRHGYPSFLTTKNVFRKYGRINWFLNKCYRLIPFLAEVKTLMDYVFTKTTLTRSEWFNFQSIYAEVYDLECSKSEKDSARGAPQHGCGKCGWFIVLAVVLLFILGPLFVLYIGITVLGVTNNPMQVSMKISLGSFEPLFQVVADSDHIKVWTKTEFENFRQNFSFSQNAEEFVKDFGYRQIVTVTVGGESKTIWIISPPQYDLLVERLSPNNTKPVRLLFEWTLTNDPAVTDMVSSYGSNSVMLDQGSEARQHLYQLLKQTKRINTTDNAIIMNLFPQYIHSQRTSSTVRPAYNLYQGTGKTFTNVRLTLRRNDSSTWWRVFDDPTPKEKPNLQLTIFSDKVSHPYLNFIVSIGWLALYSSYVLVVGNAIRQSWGSTSTIMFQELPNVKRILELCNDIYVAQENSMFKHEELLYAKLIFLYRSPTTLIKWTKPESLKENQNELNNSSQDVDAASNDAASNDAASNGSGCCCCC